MAPCLRSPRDYELRELVEKVRASGAESVAICSSFSFANPENETAVARAFARWELPVSVSHVILPDFVNMSARPR